MRVAVALLACLGSTALSPGFADPPDSPVSPEAATATTTPTTEAPSAPAPAATTDSATASPTSAAATQAATPARAAAPAQPTAPPKVDTDEKLLLASGFKPEVQNGTTVWCRRVEQIGSRVSAKKLCGTPQELALSVRELKQQLEISQRQQLNPTFH